MDLFADSVPVGTELEVRAHVSIQDLGGMGVFDCELRWTDAPEDVKHLLPPDGLLAKASLNVYSPKDGQIIKPFTRPSEKTKIQTACRYSEKTYE